MIARQQVPETESSPIAEAMNRIVMDVVQRLDGCGIAYCLLRNRDRIPQGLVSGASVCLLVDERMTVSGIVEMVADLQPVQIAQLRHGLVTTIFAVDDRMLRVDIYTGDITWRGATLRSGQDILAARSLDAGIMVASPSDQAFVSWLERLVRGKFKPEYTESIVKAIHTDPGTFRRHAEMTFGPKMASRLLQLVNDHRLQESRSLIGDLRRALWRHSLRTAPRRSMLGAARHAIGAIQNYVRPSGLNVVLLGPDGAGKTTLGSTLATLPPGTLPFATTKHVWFSHRILPSWSVIRTLIKGDKPPSRALDVNVDPYRKSEVHPVAWLLYQGYRTFDFWLSELTHIRRSNASMSLVVHDRHPLEITLDPRRYRYTGPLAIARIISQLAPRPDLIIILSGNPEVLQARKEEVSVEETQRQMESYRQYAKSIPNARLVDATQPADKVVSDVVEILVSHITNRTTTRFHLTAAPSRIDGPRLRMMERPVRKAPVR